MPSLAQKSAFVFLWLLAVEKNSASVHAMAGFFEVGELATPLTSSLQPAGMHQQYGTTGTGNVNNPTSPLAQAGSSGVGFGLEAAGRASVGIDPSGTADPGAGVQQVSTTSVGGNVLEKSPGESSGSQANAATHQATLGDANEATGRGGDGVVGGIRFTGEGEGFVTPRSEQGLPTIAEMVEGFPGAGTQLMSRVGELLRVARVATEVKGPAVQHDSSQHHEPCHERRVIAQVVHQGSWLWEKGVWVRIVARRLRWECMVRQLLCTTSRKGWSSVERRNAPAHAGLRAESPPVISKSP